MVINSTSIRNALSSSEIIIEPFVPGLLTEYAYNLRLGRHVYVHAFHQTKTMVDYTWDYRDLAVDRLILPRFSACILAHTQEFLGVKNHVAQIYVHPDAAKQGISFNEKILAPDFFNRVNLQISNRNTQPFQLFPGMVLAQVVFHKCESNKPPKHVPIRQNHTKFMKDWSSKSMLPGNIDIIN